MAAHHDHSQNSDGDSENPEELVVELDRYVSEAYRRELLDAAKRGEKPPSLRSVKDLADILGFHGDNGDASSKTTVRPETTLFEVIDSWRNLVEKLKQVSVFREYVRDLGRSFVQLGKMDPSQYRHLKTLVDLLTHCLQHFDRDPSIECRFVTLLEVMLSYADRWQPTEKVSKFWVRLMQRIPADVAPVNFRRKAYRVLVSLSWVPSSKGLLAACSFEGTGINNNGTSSATTFDIQKAPAEVQRLMKRIRGPPLPRSDSVNQMLDRLKDETDVCVAITSEKDGMGKTILAGLVAAHPSIARVFTTLWLSLGGDNNITGTGSGSGIGTSSNSHVDVLSYERYTRSLNELCSQLKCPRPTWPDAVQRFEEPALRLLREQELMAQAKQLMSDILMKQEMNMLLILDDVVDGHLIPWFRFNERQSVIITTPEPECVADQVDWTIELVPMSEEESVELFLSEANLPITHILGSTRELSAIVRHCEYNPLLVRTVGRWFQLKQVTAGLIKGMEELVKELDNLVETNTPKNNAAASTKTTSGEALEEDEVDPNMMLFDVLSLMMGPSRLEGRSTSVLFVLCFSALVVVFPNRVPLDEVLLLLEQVLKIETLAIDELSKSGSVGNSGRRKHAWFIVEGLTHMGVISVTEQKANPWVEIHHNLYKDFALLMAQELDLKATFDETVVEWNKAFVTAYFSQRIQGGNNKVDDNSWEYAVEKLPSHMLKAKLLPTAETVLCEKNFFRARVEAMGWRRAIDVQIEDCVQLQRALEDNHNVSTDSILAASSVFNRSADMITTLAEGSFGISEDDFVVEVSRAIYLIGFALSETGYFDEAQEQFDKAQSLLPQSQELRASILYGSAWTLLASNQSEKALKKIKACRKIMDSGSDLHLLYKDMLQLFGDALVAECQYKEALIFYDILVEKLRKDPVNSRIELGTALFKKSRLKYAMGEVEAARESLKECLTWKIEIGESSKSRAVAHSILGDIYMDLRQKTDAREQFESAKKTLDALHFDTANLDYRLINAKLSFLRSDFADAFRTLEYVRRVTNESPLFFLDHSAYDLRMIARVYKSHGDMATAVAVYKESVALTKERPFSIERASGLFELANCLIDQGESKEGLKSMENALEIQVVKLGESMTVITSLVCIGNVYLSIGGHDEAIAVHKRSLAIIQLVAPDNVEKIAGVLYSIGEAYDAKGSLDDAAAHFRQCLEVLKRNRPEEHPDIAKALQRLGDVTAAKNDLGTAHDYYSDALRIRRMNFDEILLAETIHSLGVLLRKRGDLDAADELLVEALEIRKKTGLKRETGETLLEIGNVYRLRSDLEAAIHLYQKGLEVLNENEDLKGNCNLALGHVHLNLGQYATASQWYGRAREIRLSSYGKDDLKSGNAARSLGYVKYLMSRRDEALVHLQEFVRVCELIGPEATNTVDYVLALVLCGDLYAASKKIILANDVWTAAQHFCEESERIYTDLPVLANMLERRLGDAAQNKPNGSGDEDETDDALEVDPEEESILQLVLFIDD